VGHFLHPVKGADLVEGVDAGGQATVEAEDLVLHNRGEGEVVEELGEELPNVGVPVLAEALVVEAVPVIDEQLRRSTPG